MSKPAFHLSSVYRQYAGLPRGIYVLFTLRIINALGSFVYPFLTMFLTVKIGLDEKDAGWYLSLYFVVMGLGYLWGGKFADQWGRKRILVVFQLLAAILYLPCAFLGNSMIIVWILMPCAFFNGAVEPTLAAIANDLTQKNNRKQAFSLIYLGFNIGFAIGSLVAGYMFTRHTPWIFASAAVTGLIITLASVFFIEETIPREEDDDIDVLDDEKPEEENLIGALLKRKNLLVFVLVSVISAFCYSQFSYCIPLQADEIFGPNGSQVYGALMTTNGLVVISMTSFIIFFTRKINPLLSIVFAGIFFALGFGMLYYVRSLLTFIFSTVIWTIGEILNITNFEVYIADHTPRSHRGRFNSIASIVNGIGQVTAPAVMGLYIQGHGLRAAWPLIFLLEIAAALFIYILYKSQKKKDIWQKEAYSA